MSWILAILIGGLVGWFSSYAFRRSERNIVSDTIAGGIGAFLGVLLFGNLFGQGGGLSANLDSFSTRGLTWALLGSLILSWIVEGISVSKARSQRNEMGAAYHQEFREKNDKNKDQDSDDIN